MSPRPILLVGCPRSGTTLLSAILHAHPDIAVAPETRFLLPAYRQRARFGNLTDPADRRALGEFVTGKKTLFNDLKIDRATVVQAVVDAPPTFGSGVACVWREFARSRGATRWVEKRPAYWREMATLMRLFPDAQVIHLVRDPRAVVASLMAVKWYKRPLPHAAALWVQADRELRKWARRLPADSYHRLRFEDLTADPRGELTRLTTFLGEPFAEQMLDHLSAADDLVPQRKTWHSRVRGPIDASRVKAWQQTLSPQDAGLIEVGAKLTMLRNGYRASGVAQRPDPSALLDFYRRLAGMRWNMSVDRLRDLERRRRFPMELAARD